MIDRHLPRFVESTAASPNIAEVKAWSSDFQWSSTYVGAITAAVFGFLAGAFAAKWKYNLSDASLAWGCVSMWLSFFMFYFADKWTDITRYVAKWWDSEEDEEIAPDAMVRKANGRGMRRLSGDMLNLLQKFGKYYPEIKLFGVNNWERRPARINREDLRRLLDYLRKIGALEGYGTNRKLTQWGEEQLTAWANRRFDKVFEFEESENPPTPDGR